jgi:GH15 family glucan-1,4-alpha-glucosidase
MSERIEDYAIIGDLSTAALVSRQGSIDWLCVPRFDSGACFAALLGTEEHGHFRIAPAGPVRAIRRRYRDSTLILETEFETDDGVVAVVDCMLPRTPEADVVRIVEGRRGRVRMAVSIVLRFDYGSFVPWVRRVDGRLLAIAGPDAVVIDTPVALHGHQLTTVGEFDVSAGEKVPFSLVWHPSHVPAPPPLDAIQELERAESWWREWASRCTYEGPYAEAVVRSLVTLKALIFAPTGGIVAAPTTSLPEQIGGVRNWDYRYTWLRDATFSLVALMTAGYVEEATAWRDWLLRAVAGDPAKLQIMYGPGGERRLTELELPWLPGYENSAPVRIGNAAMSQFQLDVYGEVIDAMYQARRAGVPPDESAWALERAICAHVETVWREPDEGLWEVRGPRRHFTHSKLMAWVAMDRAVRSVEEFGLEGPVDRWRATRDTIHEEVCRQGFNASRNSFVQSFGSDDLDASLLLLPLLGFLPADDPRVVATVDAIMRELVIDGYVYRYATKPSVDGLPPGEGAFLMCTFWLCDALVSLGRREEAEKIFERLLSLRNDVGLLSEQYDPGLCRLTGNFPQAFSHVALINTASHLGRVELPAHGRRSH